MADRIPPPVPPEAVEAAVEAAVEESTRRIREMTGNPSLTPSPLGLEAIRQEMDAAFSAAAPILLAAGRRQAAADIARQIEELTGPLVCAWTKAEAAAIAREEGTNHVD